MALAQDTSTPAVASANAQTVTTASFTPPSGAVLYAIASSDANSSAVPATSNISGTAGLTWTLRADTNTLAVSNGGQARLWTATVVTSVSMTVTFTVTAGGFNGVVLAVKVMTGADALDPVEGAVAGQSTTAVSQAVSGSSGSRPWLAVMDYATPPFAVTPNGSTTQDYALQPNGSGGGFFGGYGSTFSSPGSVTLGASNSTTGHKIQWIGFSMRALDATRPSVSGVPQGLGFTASGTTFTYTGGGATGAGCFDVLCVNGDNTVTTPSGWTLARSEVANQGAYIFYKAENGVNSAVLALGGGVSTDEAATWMRIKNAGAIDVVGGAQTNASTGASTPSFTSGTLAGSNDLAIALGALHKFVTSTTPPPGTWSTGYAEQATAISGAAGSTTGAYNSTATKSPAGTAAESPQFTYTNGTFERYTLFASFTPYSGGGGGGSAAPTGIAAAIALGSPTVSNTESAAPTGQGIAVALGSPTVALARTAAPNGLPAVVTLGTPNVTSNPGPNGLAVALALGSPTVALNLATVPGGIAIATALGAPASSLLLAAPAGLTAAVALGTPTVALARSATPAGLAFGVALGAPAIVQSTTPAGISVIITFGSPAAGPTVLAPSATPGRGWYSLLDIQRTNAQNYAEDLIPVACPNDGEPLEMDPHGRLRCHYDGFIYRP